MTIRERLAAAYAKIPALRCAGKCAEFCVPIVFTGAEYREMRRHDPPRNPAEKSAALCPLLDVAQGTCSVYPDRPTVCRLWGVVESMLCPFGCVPERVLTDVEGYEIMLEVTTISSDVPA